MSDFHYGKFILCPCCRTRTFYQDQPWKRVCLDCYLKAKGKPTPTASYAVKTAPIDQAMLRRLVQLCHPDRHGNCEASNVATRYLLQLKNSQI